MSLRVAVAAPFRAAGDRRMAASNFVVDLSLDRDGEDLVAQFDPDDVTVPDGFHPDESLLRQRSTFEKVLDACTDAGIEKQTAVAGINELQADLAVTIEAAAVLFARRQGIDVSEHAAAAVEEI